MACREWAADGIKVVGVNFDGLQGQELKQAAETLGIAFTCLLYTSPSPRD